MDESKFSSSTAPWKKTFKPETTYYFQDSLNRLSLQDMKRQDCGRQVLELWRCCKLFSEWSPFILKGLLLIHRGTWIKVWNHLDWFFGSASESFIRFLSPLRKVHLKKSRVVAHDSGSPLIKCALKLKFKALTWSRITNLFLNIPGTCYVIPSDELAWPTRKNINQ